MLYRKLAIAAILSASSGLAMAATGGIGAGAIVGIGGGGFYSGAAGTASSDSSGSATAASQVIGSGYSVQGAGGISGGSATIGGDIGIDHATISTNTSQYALTGNFGVVSPGQATTVGSGSSTTIVNGSAAFGTSANSASGNAAWGAGAFGAVLGIGALAGFGTF